ncbi:MAG: TetR/AcrR family transcriptional regulator [Candidatus Korobacteraceae bacterium]|jgi:TetR/AcrR family transcriptional repressor of nem operon
MTQGQETRKRLVETAAGIFNTRGYSGTAVSDLMAATGLQKGGIYRHFESKEQLAVEAFDYAFEMAVRARFQDFDRLTSPLQQLRHFIRNFVHRRSPIPGGCPMVNTAVENDDGNPVLKQRARQAVNVFVDRLVDTIERGIEQGEIKRDTDARTFALLLFSALEGALVVSRLQGSFKPLEAVALTLERYLDERVDLDERTASGKSSH